MQDRYDIRQLIAEERVRIQAEEKRANDERIERALKFTYRILSGTVGVFCVLWLLGVL